MSSLIADARATAIRAALAGGRVLRHGVGHIREIKHKGEIDLVTEIDVASEAEVVGIIRERFPAHRILAEEGSVGGDDARFRWLIDPLDGTTNYAHGLPFFCVSVGLEIEGEPAVGVVYDPMMDELFVAAKGEGASVNGRPISVSTNSVLRSSLLATGLPYDQTKLRLALAQFEGFTGRCRAVRRLGSAAMELAYVASGRLDGYWESTINAWDIAGGIVLVQEAGGQISNLRGESMTVDAGQIVSSNGVIHDQMLSVLVGVQGELP